MVLSTIEPASGATPELMTPPQIPEPVLRLYGGDREHDEQREQPEQEGLPQPLDHP